MYFSQSCVSLKIHKILLHFTLFANKTLILSIKNSFPILPGFSGIPDIFSTSSYLFFQLKKIILSKKSRWTQLILFEKKISKFARSQLACSSVTMQLTKATLGVARLTMLWRASSGCFDVWWVRIRFDVTSQINEPLKIKMKVIFYKLYSLF